MSAAAGVMLFVSFADILPESILEFEEDENHKEHATRWS